MDYESMHIRYENEKQPKHTYLKELRCMDIPNNIKYDVTYLYNDIVANKTKRRNPRRSLIYHCLIYCCKQSNYIFDSDKFMVDLEISQKVINSGRKLINELKPELDVNLSIEDVLICIINVCDFDEVILDEVMDLYFTLCDNISDFNSRKLSTVAPVTLFIYLKNNEYKFDENMFSSNVNIPLSRIIEIAYTTKNIIELSF